MALLRNGAVAEDPWVHAEDDDPLHDGAAAIVGLSRWQAERDALLARNAPVGIRLCSNESPAAVAGDLDRFGVVALEFPVFKDGRAFSYARLLRERYRYQGEVRAFGHILRDQYLFLDRCGVDSIEVEDEKALEEWRKAASEFSVWYQPAADSRRPVAALRRNGRGPAPPSTGHAAAAESRVRAFSGKYGHLPAKKLLARMIEDEFYGRIALVSSFGSESAILLHMVAEIDLATPVIFLDTGKLFSETLRYRDALVEHLGLCRVRSVQPDPDRVRALDPDGMLWKRDHDACCRMRKVEPLAPALEGLDAWITGRKRYQGQRRAVLPVIEAQYGRVKINPLASWSRDFVEEYFDEYRLPRHSLQTEGYQSIGCMPCTDRIAPGEAVRAGRWRGSDKSECGIHETPTGQSLTSSGL